MCERRVKMGRVRESAEERGLAAAQALAALLAGFALIVATTRLPPQVLILDWRRERGQWFAWVIWVDNGSLREGVRQAWLPLSVLRPARSDINVWNDRPRR
jgi:hypothetical protein